MINNQEKSVEIVKHRPRIGLVNCRSILNKSGIPGVDFGINPYVGCSHKCQYCYAVFMKKFTGHSEPWGNFVDVKINAPMVLKKQLARLKQNSTIMFGTVCDAYQPVENEYRITRDCLAELIDTNHKISILTKSSLVLRDVDILKKISGQNRLEVGFTITSVDKNVENVFEPGASSTYHRFKTLSKLSQAGIKTWVFVAPILPGITDTKHTLRQIIIRSQESGARYILFDTLNPYPKVWANVKKLVYKFFPGAIQNIIQYARNPGKYGPQLQKKVVGLGLENLIPCRFAFGCGK